MCSSKCLLSNKLRVFSVLVLLWMSNIKVMEGQLIRANYQQLSQTNTKDKASQLASASSFLYTNAGISKSDSISKSPTTDLEQKTIPELMATLKTLLLSKKATKPKQKKISKHKLKKKLSNLNFMPTHSTNRMPRYIIPSTHVMQWSKQLNEFLKKGNPNILNPHLLKNEHLLSTRTLPKNEHLLSTKTLPKTTLVTANKISPFLATVHSRRKPENKVSTKQLIREQGVKNNKEKASHTIIIAQTANIMSSVESQNNNQLSKSNINGPVYVENKTNVSTIRSIRSSRIIDNEANTPKTPNASVDKTVRDKTKVKQTEPVSLIRKKPSDSTITSNATSYDLRNTKNVLRRSLPKTGKPKSNKNGMANALNIWNSLRKRVDNIRNKIKRQTGINHNVNFTNEHFDLLFSLVQMIKEFRDYQTARKTHGVKSTDKISVNSGNAAPNIDFNTGTTYPPTMTPFQPDNNQFQFAYPSKTSPTSYQTRETVQIPTKVLRKADAQSRISSARDLIESNFNYISEPIKTVSNSTNQSQTNQINTSEFVSTKLGNAIGKVTNGFFFKSTNNVSLNTIETRSDRRINSSKTSIVKDFILNPLYDRTTSKQIQVNFQNKKNNILVSYRPKSESKLMSYFRYQDSTPPIVFSATNQPLVTLYGLKEQPHNTTPQPSQKNNDQQNRNIRVGTTFPTYNAFHRPPRKVIRQPSLRIFGQTNSKVSTQPSYSFRSTSSLFQQRNGVDNFATSSLSAISKQYINTYTTPSTFNFQRQSFRELKQTSHGRLQQIEMVSPKPQYHTQSQQGSLTGMHPRNSSRNDGIRRLSNNNGLFHTQMTGASNNIQNKDLKQNIIKRHQKIPLFQKKLALLPSTKQSRVSKQPFQHGVHVQRYANEKQHSSRIFQPSTQIQYNVLSEQTPPNIFIKGKRFQSNILQNQNEILQRNTKLPPSYQDVQYLRNTVQSHTPSNSFSNFQSNMMQKQTSASANQQKEQTVSVKTHKQNDQYNTIQTPISFTTNVQSQPNTFSKPQNLQNKRNTLPNQSPVSTFQTIRQFQPKVMQYPQQSVQNQNSVSREPKYVKPTLHNHLSSSVQKLSKKFNHNGIKHQNQNKNFNNKPTSVIHPPLINQNIRYTKNQSFRNGNVWSPQSSNSANRRITMSQTFHSPQNIHTGNSVQNNIVSANSASFSWNQKNSSTQNSTANIVTHIRDGNGKSGLQSSNSTKSTVVLASINNSKTENTINSNTSNVNQVSITNTNINTRRSNADPSLPNNYPFVISADKNVTIIHKKNADGANVYHIIHKDESTTTSKPGKRQKKSKSETKPSKDYDLEELMDFYTYFY